MSPGYNITVIGEKRYIYISLLPAAERIMDFRRKKITNKEPTISCPVLYSLLLFMRQATNNQYFYTVGMCTLHIGEKKTC